MYTEYTEIRQVTLAELNELLKYKQGWVVLEEKTLYRKRFVETVLSKCGPFSRSYIPIYNEGEEIVYIVGKNDKEVQ